MAKIDLYVTVKVTVDIDDRMEVTSAIDEFYNLTNVTLEETENVGIESVEMLDVTDEDPWGEEGSDLELDQEWIEGNVDDEFYFKSQPYQMKYVKNLPLVTLIDMDRRREFTVDELTYLDPWDKDDILKARNY